MYVDGALISLTTGHCYLVSPSSPLLLEVVTVSLSAGSRLLSSGPQPSGENLECPGQPAPLH